MSFVRLVASEGEPTDGPLRLCRLPARDATHVLSSDAHLPEAHDSSTTNHQGENRMAEQDGIERQLRQMETMARQLFPDDESAANQHLVTLLKQRIREMGYRTVPLQVRDEMPHDPRP